jgi:hypothetical protein
LDELSQRLNSLLSDPEAMGKMAEAARSLFEPEPEQKREAPPLDLSALMGAAAPLLGGQENPRLAMLRSIAPYLSADRGKRLERAIRMSGMAASALRLLREYGGEGHGNE